MSQGCEASSAETAVMQKRLHIEMKHVHTNKNCKAVLRCSIQLNKRFNLKINESLGSENRKFGYQTSRSFCLELSFSSEPDVRFCNVFAVQNYFAPFRADKGLTLETSGSSCSNDG